MSPQFLRAPRIPRHIEKQASEPLPFAPSRLQVRQGDSCDGGSIATRHISCAPGRAGRGVAHRRRLENPSNLAHLAHSRHIDEGRSTKRGSFSLAGKEKRWRACRPGGKQGETPSCIRGPLCGRLPARGKSRGPWNLFLKTPRKKHQRL